MLYVTDLRLTHGAPSGVFEHLSCFLPGLFALGAHLLPLDDLPSLGIDYLGLAADLSPVDREGYELLSKYNLKKLHMWAAKGLTETCYLTYADQPWGLCPDEILLVPGGTPWMEVMEKWRMHGGRGPIPGLGKKEPVVIPMSEADSEYKKHVEMDYWIRDGSYKLRPEVSQQPSPISGLGERLTGIDRLWNRCTFYGERRGSDGGGSMLGRFLSRSRSTRRRRVGIVPSRSRGMGV